MSLVLVKHMSCYASVMSLVLVKYTRHATLVWCLLYLSSTGHATLVWCLLYLSSTCHATLVWCLQFNDPDWRPLGEPPPPAVYIYINHITFFFVCQLCQLFMLVNGLSCIFPQVRSSRRTSSSWKAPRSLLLGLVLSMPWFQSREDFFMYFPFLMCLYQLLLLVLPLFLCCLSELSAF